jgi:hypothetical protein
VDSIPDLQKSDLIPEVFSTILSRKFKTGWATVSICATRKRKGSEKTSLSFVIG